MRLTYIMLAALLISACQQAPQEVPQIGGLFCQTGFASFAGESSKDGFLLAIADAQERGVEVEYKIEDCESDLTKTVTAARTLTDVYGVKVIIGPEWELAAAISPMAEQGEALFISPWLTMDPEWTDPELFMSAMPREQVFSDGFTEWMVEQGIERVAFAGSIDDFAETVERTVRSSFDERGVELVRTFSMNVDEPDFRTQILQIKKLDVDAVLVAFATDAAEARFIRQARELGLETKILIHYARGESGGFLEACADACEGVVFASPRPPARSAEFAEKFHAHYGKDPLAPSAATAYDATTAVISAFDAGARSPQEVQQFLARYRAEGYSGTVAFDDGFLEASSASVIIKQIESGQRIVIG